MKNMNSDNQYNNIPVSYCSKCLSLRIKTTGDNMDYCDECGCSDIELDHILNWLYKYQAKYQHPYIQRDKIKPFKF